jgi:hypothetical protein
MKTVGTYSNRLEADVAKLELDRAGIPSVVIGIGVGMEGGAVGVQLRVPSEHLDEALSLLASE